jgi:hypothetical protein
MLSWIALHWKASALVACAIGIAAASVRLLETDQVRAQRGRSVHHRYPTGDVVVSEKDLAERFRKPPETILTALNILLGEQKVQRTPISGYWRLTA